MSDNGFPEDGENTRRPARPDERPYTSGAVTRPHRPLDPGFAYYLTPMELSERDREFLDMMEWLQSEFSVALAAAFRDIGQFFVDAADELSAQDAEPGD